MKPAGFAPILIIIPVAVVSLASVALVSLKSESPQESPQPRSISRSIIESPSPLEALASTESEASVEPSPTPSPEDELKIDYQTFAREAPSPSPTPKVISTPSSTTSGGNYTVSTFDLASTTVVTDTANDNDCPNDCPTKALAQFVAENGGRAGIHGSYFCPPDYSSCGGKVNSFDFSVWNNRQKKWINAYSLFWNGRGMMVFRPGSAQFFPCAACVGAPSDITGGLTNYPSLLSGGQVLVSDGPKGTRGGIGFGSGKLFLVVARNASFLDLANIFKSLGATDALNLDGGGSSALYDGGYKAGPGRSLPNAIIVK
ncbi:hypothetical protein A3J17_03385 [Candidatus Curtissbacteria bacterium RIFCSPLOWO2_02_FULL_40_11]|uniref:Phosphodiester glycosidase domain-containing protein n=2 Tax=Candidatus Curtissiibacteriota TaxID=1752717 RepID=A0A1F5G715_9BACT|nr:MAG: hypothetical protein A3D04_02270 [Candidatus Curtissbacteria bacterium RIFCSPHIGHO2_02_FULL_40_16b]OGE00802.1 MAG: hypothetical protein A3J17_03385 [Candidatus Curtissbacteria bacterium RIFCSPLOWO2_02_FULL_40_11]OGE14143.1 MAG: hypothetical protein A3G14_02460 [Candidatus Curtissbacteria bacterium RIFCSPLOWO2_12_FULL_38_9]